MQQTIKGSPRVRLKLLFIGLENIIKRSGIGL